MVPFYEARLMGLEVISQGLCGKFGGNYSWREDPRPCPAEEQGII